MSLSEQAWNRGDVLRALFGKPCRDSIFEYETRELLMAETRREPNQGTYLDKDSDTV